MIINWNWYCKTHQAGIDIEIGIAEKPYLVLSLLLILQRHLLSYWYWYCYCKTLLADVDIDVAIAIQLYPISLLVLVLQNHHLNIEDQTISEILVLRSPALKGDSELQWKSVFLYSLGFYKMAWLSRTFVNIHVYKTSLLWCLLPTRHVFASYRCIRQGRAMLA